MSSTLHQNIRCKRSNNRDTIKCIDQVLSPLTQLIWPKQYLVNEALKCQEWIGVLSPNFNMRQWQTLLFSAYLSLFGRFSYLFSISFSENGHGLGCLLLKRLASLSSPLYASTLTGSWHCTTNTELLANSCD